MWTLFWIWVLSHMTRPSWTVLGNRLSTWWQWKHFFPIFPPCSIWSFDAVFRNSRTSWVSSLFPSSSTSDPHFWNQCFFFFFFFFYQCMYLWLWESWGGGEGGGRGVLDLTGSPEEITVIFWGFVLKMFKWLVKFLWNKCCFQNGLELKGLPSSGLLRWSRFGNCT